MATVMFGENPVNTFGDLPAIGQDAPDFKLTGVDFGTVSKGDFSGKKMILNIFPTIATSVCSASVRKFNEKASGLDNTVVLCISKDLPLALKGFCGAEGLEDVISLSDFRGEGFAEDYGMLLVEGNWRGLLARSVVVVDENGKVVYHELVPAIGQEPDYESAVAAL